MTSTPGNAGLAGLVADEVRFEQHGAVALVTLTRPHARNAINVGLAQALSRALDAVEQSSEIAVCILLADTGGNGVYCAGADLKDLAAGRADELSNENGLGGLTERMRAKPLIAAVDGLALGGGCELVLACDLVVASTISGFGLPEVRRNLLASAGGVYRLPRALGTRVAMEAVLTGKPVSAERAYQLGMVNHLVESSAVLDTALSLAADIAAAAPVASRLARSIVLDAWRREESELRASAVAASVQLRAMADTREGVLAFTERRVPVWRGL